MIMTMIMMKFRLWEKLVVYVLRGPAYVVKKKMITKRSRNTKDKTALTVL